jgi:dTDP-4-amino-4,6-dideoxygalactose transaminase
MKEKVDDLAVFGGIPAFQEDLHVGRPNIGNREQLLARINDLLDRKWLSNDGPYVKEFEKQVAKTADVKHCIAMCNGAIALEIAIRALGFSGEVIVPSFTFIATAHALQWQEITPVFCDVDRKTHNLDPGQIEQMITPRTTGIIGVHLWGRACDVEALTDIAERHQLKLLFDAAHALGCSYRGQMIGGFGNAEVFSFHATKFLNTFEGGAVVTNDDELAARIRLMKNFGFAGYDDVSYIGTNGKMNEVSAAMGITSLESMDDFIAVNYQNYRQYRQQLSDIPGIKVHTYDEQERCNYQYIILEVDPSIATITRDQIQKILWAERVLARRYFYPACHRMEPYRSYFPHAGLLLPNTVELASQVLALPTGTGVSAEDIMEICGIIRWVAANAGEISDRLAGQ